jgi:hypothetical protein
MRCSNCGHDNRTGAKFCEECGTHLVKVCPSCAAELSPTAKFCSQCGQWCTSSLAQVHDDSTYTIVPESPFWYAPASVLGTILAYLIVYLPHGLLLPVRIRVLGILLAIGSLALAYFAAHSSLRLAENEIIFCRLWSVQEERLTYSEIRALKEVYDPSDEKVVFVIESHDAPEWTTAVEAIFPDQREKSFLSERTGKIIEKVIAK